MQGVEAAQARVAHAADTLSAAEARLATFRDQPKRMMREGARHLAAAAAAPLTDGDLESMRAMRSMRSPAPTALIVARCACTLLSVDIPGGPKLSDLLAWDDAKRVLARTDFASCVRRFDAARLVDQPQLVSVVHKRARWAAATSSTAADYGAKLTMESAHATSSSVGALFGWCSRILTGLDALRAAAVMSDAARDAEMAAEKDVTQRQLEWEHAIGALRQAEEAEAQERVRRAAAEQARCDAEARARREAEEQAQREAEAMLRREEERARRAAEERARRESEETAAREAAERAQRKAAREREKREVEARVRREAEEREARARREAEEADAALREVCLPPRITTIHTSYTSMGLPWPAALKHASLPSALPCRHTPPSARDAASTRDCEHVSLPACACPY